MPRPLVDLLWRAHPDAPRRGARGPAARHTTGDVVDQAIRLADAGGLSTVTVRALAHELGLSAMSVYTHVNSRDDLLVLMVDQAHARMPRPAYGRTGWRARVRRVAEANLALLREHPWLLEVADARTALGPGTIAKYDHELHAFDPAGLTDLERDAALSFVLDYTRSAAPALIRGPDDFGETWSEQAGRLAGYLGEDFPLAQTVGRAAGESMGGPYDADRAWRFGLARVLAGLGELIDG